MIASNAGVVSAHAAGTLDRAAKQKVARYFAEAHGDLFNDGVPVDEGDLRGKVRKSVEELKRKPGCVKQGYCPQVHTDTADGVEVLKVLSVEEGSVAAEIFSRDGESLIALCVGPDSTSCELKVLGQ